MTWVVRAVAAAAVLVVAWVCLTAWPAVVHGHPAYAVLLVLTVLVAVLVAALSGRRREPSVWRTVGRGLLVLLSVAWIAAIAWLRPYVAQEPALAALQSDAAVTVDEYPTQIVLTPTAGAGTTGLVFEPGALVDPRAYAAVLRPVAAAGHLVVIVKQPLGIAFLSLGTFARIRDAYPAVTSWVVGGHSLGGTVAAMEADAHDGDTIAPVRGLLFYASYPAGDISGTLTATVLSISASLDGLATPDKVAASRADLPPSAHFVVVDGAVHSSFGDYGEQKGDGTPTIPHDEARTQISAATVSFVNRVG